MTGPPNSPSTFAIRNCAPDAERAGRWGDTHFAASLAGSLAKRGYEAVVHTRDQWDADHAHGFDVVIHLRGVERYRPRRDSVNLLWILNHIDAVTGEELDEYDCVAVASSSAAEKLASRTARPVHVLRQCTDTTAFRPVNRELCRPAGGVVVVANARWPFRPGPRWLIELGQDFSLYGANWESYPEHRHVVTDYVPNDELADIYATADIVVADQWDHMAREGFVANRLFDIAAAGGFVISDAGPGIREVFGDLVPTYSTRGELRDQLARYLPDIDRRRATAHELMALVRSHHSFDRRVDELLTLIATATLDHH